MNASKASGLGNWKDVGIPFRKTAKKAGGGGNQEFISGQVSQRCPTGVQVKVLLCGVRPTHLAFGAKVQSEDRNWKVLSVEADSKSRSPREIT